MNIEKNSFVISTENENSKTDIFIAEQAEKHVIVKLSIRFKEKITPLPVRVDWTIPVGNILSVWTPLIGFSRALSPNWRRTKSDSKTAVGAPVLSLVNNDGTNACTIAISDPKTPTEIGAGISEETGEFCCNTIFFTSYISPIDFFEAYIRIDFDEVLFVDAVKKVNRWWETDFGYSKSYVPKEAYLPMDSAWYSFHQDLNPESLIEECKLASKLGMKTLIIDDGWQTTDNTRGYRYCGDWKLAIEKIPSMSLLVNEIHRLGMKVMLWYSVPFVGIYSEAYKRFQDKALREDKGVLTVDLRYREVREYLVNIYVETVRSFGLDGLKLDFIDWFKLVEETPAVNDQMDIPSIEDALEELLKQTKEALVQINPEILLEFRQSYMGPVVLKYGNMIRVRDCPYDSMTNRAGILNLRLTSGAIAVHSDMVMWNKDAPIEAVSRQLISTLFGVPQVSLKLNELPQKHLDAIEFWLNFYTENIEILHSDELYVKNPELSYTQAKTCKNGSVIGVNYANVPFEIGKFQNKDAKYTLINSSNENNLCVFAEQPMGQCRIRVFDCVGKMISESVNEIQVGAVMLNVPICGFVEITKNNIF